MSKEFIITQEELDMLEAIRLNIYNTYVVEDSICDIIKAQNVTEQLWKVINKRRPIVSEKHALVHKRLRTNEALEEELLSIKISMQEVIDNLEASEDPFYTGIKQLKELI